MSGSILEWTKITNVVKPVYADIDSFQKGKSVFFMGTELRPNKAELDALRSFIDGLADTWIIQTAANEGGVTMLERVQIPIPVAGMFFMGMGGPEFDLHATFSTKAYLRRSMHGCVSYLMGLFNNLVLAMNAENVSK